MMQLQAVARYTYGTACVQRIERDDAVGRREMDKAAFALLARADVASVDVTHVKRCAGTNGRKSYR